MNKKIVLGLLTCFGVSPVAAQEVDEIIVSATGIPTPAHEIGASVDVITAQDLQTQQITYLQEALKLKGINVPQNGGPGTLSNVFLRGLPGKYTTLVVDGISMFDPGSNQVLWNDVVSDGVERVEILRGSQGVMFGSNTIAGVVSQFTAIGGEAQNNMRLESGEMATQRLTVTGQGSTEKTQYGYGLSYFSSDSISASSIPAVGSSTLDDDAYENMTLNAKIAMPLSDAIDMQLVLRNSAGALDKDGFSSDAAGISEDFDRHALRLALDGTFGAWQHRLGVSDYDATIEDYSGGAQTGERLAARQSIDYRGVYQWRDGVQLIIGAENISSEFENTDSGFSAFARAESDVTGLFGLLQYQTKAGLNVTAALRQDDHDVFGTHETYRLTAAYAVRDGLVMRGAHGTGYRAPSLSELYLAFYGNADLQPETSTSTEAGFDLALSSNTDFSATVFAIEVDDIIGYDPATYVNTQISGTSEVSGVELSLALAPSPAWHLSIDAAYTDSDKPNADGSAGSTREVRVPRMQAGFVVAYEASDRLSLGGSLRAVRDTLDVGNVKLNDYTLLDMRAQYRLSDTVVAYGRLENAMDEDYEIINGFSTPGRAAYLGMTTRF